MLVYAKKMSHLGIDDKGCKEADCCAAKNMHLGGTPPPSVESVTAQPRTQKVRPPSPTEMCVLAEGESLALSKHLLLFKMKKQNT